MRGIVLALATLPGAAAGDGLGLTPADRAAFGAEVRALLLDEPEIVARALRGPDPYAAEIASDLALIADHADRLFDPGATHLLGDSGPVALAVFAPPDSATATRLDSFARTRGLRIALHPPARTAALMQALTLDTVPSYVFPRIMVRGAVPSAVLDRYLAQ
jgi:hypothetical protein